MPTLIPEIASGPLGFMSGFIFFLTGLSAQLVVALPSAQISDRGSPTENKYLCDDHRRLFSVWVLYCILNEEYKRMPPVIHLDPFEVCLRDPEGLYCTADIAFVADAPSALYTQMQEYSLRTTTHFNHTHAIFGTCMTDTCKAFNTTDLRVSLEACRNQTLYEQYKLKVLVEDMSCVPLRDKVQIGPAHIVVAAICVAVVILNAIGSLCDIFYKLNSGVVSQLFICFSIRRNWRRLVAEPGTRDPRQKRFKAFYGIRAILMTLVIIAHAMLPAMLINDNTKFFEDQFEQTWLHILLNGTLIMQTFLQLSALLLVYNALVVSETRKLTWTILPLGVVKRWLRLTPTYGLVLGVTATWLPYTGTGPLWDRIVSRESRDCQKDWWKHLLYINNYIDDSRCMPQSWYLAADTQLYILGIAVFVVCKKPWIKKLVLSILFLIGLVVPGIHTYFQDLDGTLIVSPTTAVELFLSDLTFNNVYKRGHTNLAGYVLGLAFGYLVYHLQTTNFDASKYKRWRPLYWALFPLGVCIILACKLNYGEGPRASLLARVATSCTIKPTFGLVSLTLVSGMIFKFENLYRGIVEWRGWTCIGRLSYSAYLLHVAFIRTAAGSHTTSFSGTYMRMSEIVLFCLVVTYAAAFVFYITVETPLGELVKCILDPKKPEPVEEKVEKNEIRTKL